MTQSVKQRLYELLPTRGQRWVTAVTSLIQLAGIPVWFILDSNISGPSPWITTTLLVGTVELIISLLFLIYILYMAIEDYRSYDVQ